MELTYQQVLAEAYEENSKNILIHHNDYDDEDKPAYEKYDYQENELEDQEEFQKFHGDRNKPEHVIKPSPKNDSGGKSGIKHATDVKTIVLNIDGAFREGIVPPTSSSTCNVSEYAVANIFMQGTQSSWFVFQAKQLYKNITSIKLTSLEFYNSFYTFSATRGNTSFTITTLNSSNVLTPTIINIPSGNYSYSDIISAINQQLSTISNNNITINYDPIGHTITFVNTISNPFTINFPATQTNPYGNGIGYNLGFLQQTYQAQSNISGYIIQSDQSPDLVQDTYIYLQINDWNLVEHQLSSQTYFSVFAKILLNGQKNAIVYDTSVSNTTTKEYVFPQPTNVQKLEIKMLDAYGTPLELRGTSFSMTLELQQVNNSGVYEKLLEL